MQFLNFQKKDTADNCLWCTDRRRTVLSLLDEDYNNGQLSQYDKVKKKRTKEQVVTSSGLLLQCDTVSKERTSGSRLLPAHTKILKISSALALKRISSFVLTWIEGIRQSFFLKATGPLFSCERKESEHS